MKKDQYLSDLELEALIMEIEDGDMVSAPADMTDNIISLLNLGVENELEQTAKSEIKAEPEEGKNLTYRKTNNKITEFRNYCIRVAAVAATVACIAVTLPGMSINENFVQKEIPSKQEVLGRIDNDSILYGSDKKGFLSTIGSSDKLSNLEPINIFRN